MQPIDLGITNEMVVATLQRELARAQFHADVTANILWALVIIMWLAYCIRHLGCFIETLHDKIFEDPGLPVLMILGTLIITGICTLGIYGNLENMKYYNKNPKAYMLLCEQNIKSRNVDLILNGNVPVPR